MSPRRYLGPLLAATGLAALAAGLLVLPTVLHPPLTAADLRGVTDPRARIELQQAQSRLANEARAAILQGLAGLLVALGAAATWRQVQTNREGQLTERFTRAVDQLGSDKVDVRVGGVYALERIARNSAADSDHVQFLLGSFIRNHAPWPGPGHPTPDVDMTLPWMRFRAPDVQAAAGALGRRRPAAEPPVIYLSRVDLRSISLRNARFTGAKLRYANLARAVLIGVFLDRSDLTGADLRQAHLNGTNLHGATLRRALLQGANLRGADLRGARLDGAVLDGAVLTGARADATTTWPPEFDQERRRSLGVVD